jgi:ribulose kinase
MATNSDEYYIAVDVGTSSVRTAVVDRGGRMNSFASEEIRIWQSSSNMYEQSSEDIWSCLCTAVRVQYAVCMLQIMLIPSSLVPTGYCNDRP